MERVAWTDERITDAMTRMDRGFDELRTELRTGMHDLRAEMRELRTATSEGFHDMRQDVLGLQRQLATIGWGIAAALLGQFIALIVALVVTQA